ncbi:MAG TPA: MBOAT family O-acyltransferase [Clostridia bacterium]|nr:MBOAT family O-acyltransferase [Clostridia bacterium]
MTFTTLTFLLCFFPLLAVMYFLCPANRLAVRNGILLAFSLVFYAWGEPIYVLLIVLCAGLTYLLSYAVQRGNHLAFILSLLANLLPLLVFKYANFILLNIGHITGSLPMTVGLAMPIGISFYTFQVITYIIDLYRGQVQLQRNWAYLLLYIFFFPQLVAGPIVRYADVEKEIGSRKTAAQDLIEGAQRIVIGLSKKMLVANPAGEAVRVIRAQNQALVGPGLLWICVISYGIQIYFDFSAYSDMAIGLGRIFGFHFLENFNKPYIACSVTDFWRRWHISLSTFFRDYVYIPMGGNRVSVFRHLFNLLVVWLLTGLWHGAYWNYAFWGFYYFVLLALEKYVIGRSLERLPAFLARGVTFFFYMFGWAIFLFESNSAVEVGLFLLRLFGAFSSGESLRLRALEIQGNFLVVLIGLLLSTTNLEKPFRAIFSCLPRALKYMLSGLCLLVLLVSSLLSIIGSSFNPFIYFRF